MMQELNNWKAYAFAGIAVVLATLVAVVLDHWIHPANLVLVYVLAVVITGLRYGSLQAVIASVLSFLSFNFFLTVPRYTFEVAQQDELATLIFLSLIAIICGPAASRIRQQIILLQETNRYSEAMRNLAEALAIAENTDAVWLATADELSSILQVESIIAVPDETATYRFFPKPSKALADADMTLLTATSSNDNWTSYPVYKNDKCIAHALLHLGKREENFSAYNLNLLQSMLQQAANTWQRIQLVNDLESARVKTEVEQLRSALLSSVSHDLKSPLAAMMGAAESLALLDKKLAPEDRQELIETILQESRRLDSYIQNLLDMTRLGYGTLKIERDWVSVADIVGSALTRLRRYFANIKTEVQFTDTAPLLYVHPALIEQALFNILENAARFNPEDEKIRIMVTTENTRCIITIEDSGPGINPALREKIFDMFYVVADGDSKRHGTGMGLAICRSMLGAHGGTVRAEAGTGGKGTRFVVDLPYQDPSISDTPVDEI